MTPRPVPGTRPAVPEALAWLLEGHGGRCGCSGQCGRRHGGGRCEADELASLSVAPVDLTIPDWRAATLPADALIVWCHRCRDLATAAANRRRREQVDAAFKAARIGLWGAG